MNTPARLARCLKLLNLLQAGVGCNIEHLALELSVSKRTVHRDLKLLRMTGIPVSHDPTRRGYILRPMVGVKITATSDEELAALLLAAHVFALSCAGTLGRVVRQAISKILGQTRTAIRDEIAGLLNSIDGNLLPTLSSASAQHALH